MKALKQILILLAFAALFAPNPAVARGSHSQPSSYGGYGGYGYGYGSGYGYGGTYRPRAMYCTYYGCYVRRRYRRFSFSLGFPGFNFQFSTGWTPSYAYRPFMGGLFGRGLGGGMVGF